jgi:hypothetical protein
VANDWGLPYGLGAPGGATGFQQHHMWDASAQGGDRRFSIAGEKGSLRKSMHENN